MPGDVACGQRHVLYDYEGPSEAYDYNGEPARERYLLRFILEEQSTTEGVIQIERYEVLVRPRMSCSPHGGVLPRTYARRDSRGIPEQAFAEAVGRCSSANLR